MKTASTNKKIRELIELVKDDKLIPRPEFQRRLVWTNKDKDLFLDTVIRGYPFPEIYIADDTVDLDSGRGTQLLVDGLQRVNTIIEYFEGAASLRLLTVLPYKDLPEQAKKDFLQYDVSVRDLGGVHRDDLVEVFKRINATKYSLLDIEVNNAVYAGVLKQYAQRLADDRFFLENGVFDSRDFKRMGDLRYALALICTFLGGYFNRDDEFGEYLARYNDLFQEEEEIDARIRRCFEFILECGFDVQSRIWKKADLFTLLVELDASFRSGRELQPSVVVAALDAFFNGIKNASVDSASVYGVYYKAALQATNDRGNRLRRAEIIQGVINGLSNEIILERLQAKQLV